MNKNGKPTPEESLHEAIEKYNEAISYQMQPVIIAFSNFLKKLIPKYFGL